VTGDLYVPTDANGFEHTPGGVVAWISPDGGMVRTATSEQPVLLREAGALLDVLDECIYRAEALGESATSSDGVVSARAGRLRGLTPWDTEAAAAFALDCVVHVLGDSADATLPDGTTFAEVVAEARGALGGLSDAAGAHLGLLVRLGALHRLKKDRWELGAVATGLVSDDVVRHLDALEDPRYEAIAPIVDAVLAAIEALRHHVLPRLLVGLEDSVEENEEHRVLDRQTVLHVPRLESTAWGPVEVGGSPSLPFEPAWSSAREAARHARTCARSRGGAPAESDERAWQAARLSDILGR